MISDFYYIVFDPSKEQYQACPGCQNQRAGVENDIATSVPGFMAKPLKDSPAQNNSTISKPPFAKPPSPDKKPQAQLSWHTKFVYSQ